VAEFSSHQLMDSEVSPHVAVLLDLFQDHLDYYPSLEAYIDAKAPITRYQSEKDVLILNPSNPHAQRIAQSTKATKIALTENESFPIAPICRPTTPTSISQTLKPSFRCPSPYLFLVITTATISSLP
jgi:UDP-N-acetylmuramoylalanine-D-glutamate ligase